ncbi:MAG TPA: hydroxymethylpyrimidine/phosphomethylpyrimidine kinase [Gammaproteobacteria bacterium]|jgi:hydroxymethylpyrimidine/phosphomethylpyrimidine kinase
MGKTDMPPVVLLIAGNDPSGGAGLAADIQAVTAVGAHPTPVVTALTVQDSRNVHRVQAVAAEWVSEQARVVLTDMPVAAIKLGLLSNAATGRAVAALLREHARIPVVVDPVLTASGGTVLADEALLDVYLKDIFPLATLITPNAAESRRFVPQARDVAGRAAALLQTGARHVLIKGGDEQSPEVHNHLFGPSGLHEETTWPRLPGDFHGSGCTLASAIAARLALGADLSDAVREGLRYTWEALARAWPLGHGGRIPARQP